MQTKKISKRKIIFIIASALLAVAVVLSIILSLTLNSSSLELENTPTLDSPDVFDKPTNTTPILPDEPVVKKVSFIMPVDGTLFKGYSEVPVFNSTLNRYSSHLALDFSAKDGAEVYAVYDGKVSSVTESITKGVSVTIDHGNGLYTVYNSLENGTEITVGTNVKAGDVIGNVSTSNRQEYKDGAHLHFETIENGEIINPEKYLIIDAK
jgi:murein DD-endopeptidase MepM/ murein hydrolase activator NlpD